MQLKASSLCWSGFMVSLSSNKLESQLKIIFIGGGYSSGSTHGANPETLMRSQSVTGPFIFASFAYRVGQFGFLGEYSIDFPHEGAQRTPKN